MAQGEDGLCRRRIGCRRGAGGRRLGLHFRQRARWELMSQSAVHAVSLLRPDGHVCRGVCGALGEGVCVRTGMAWSSDLLSVLLVWLLASPLPSVGCGSCVPNSLICSPACQGAWNLAQSRTQRGAPHRTQNASAGGTAAAAQAKQRAGPVDAGRGGARDVVCVGDVGAPGRGWRGTWVRGSLHPARRRFDSP